MKREKSEMCRSQIFCLNSHVLFVNVYGVGRRRSDVWLPVPASLTLTG